jgi:hypothetical protein
VHGDFSRWIFSPERHYSRVVVQQGRVSLDADANAQASIYLHYVRTLAADLIGPAGGPMNDVGFNLTVIAAKGGKNQTDATLTIGGGRYYVDGLLCEASENALVDYFQQPDAYLAQSGISALPDVPYLVWLKVWEQFVTSVEDPVLREVALGLNGPDTTGRSKVIWQVLASPWPEQVDFPKDQLTAQLFYDQDYWIQLKPLLCPSPSGTLMAQAVQPQAATDACILPPNSGYRGPENQLYRVEIHQDGTAAAGAAEAGGPTFMWSRDNGSVILPMTGISGKVVSVTTLGRDPQLSVDVGNYVEIVDDAYAAQGQPGPIPRYPEPLHLVTGVDPVQLSVTLDQAPATKAGSDPALHPYLRRWDQGEVLVTKAGLTIDSQDEAIDIVAGQWIDLEDGVQIQFSAGTYRAGDYWLIPARVITGNVEWPVDSSQQALALPPAGVQYHSAPLAVVDANGSLVNLRMQFASMAEVMPAVVSGGTAQSTQSSTSPRSTSRTPRTQRKS